MYKDCPVIDQYSVVTRYQVKSESGQPKTFLSIDLRRLAKSNYLLSKPEFMGTVMDHLVAEMNNDVQTASTAKDVKNQERYADARRILFTNFKTFKAFVKTLTQKGIDLTQYQSSIVKINNLERWKKKLPPLKTVLR